MLKKASNELKSLFLLLFTRELIRNSKTTAIFELENVLNQKAKEEKREQDLSNIIKDMEKNKFEITDRPSLRLKEPIDKTFKTKFQVQKPINNILRIPPEEEMNRILKIPNTRLPPRLSYLKPVPRDVRIDLGKLNPLIKDPIVTSIECNGPNEKIIVLTGSRKATNIILSKEEVDDIIRKFSETAKIPQQEGIFKVVVGRLVLSAIISEVIGSKFIIKKLFNYPLKSFR